MLINHENYSLLPLNTFHIDVNAESYIEISSNEELLMFLNSGLIKKYSDDRLLVLGGGSNILFTSDYKGLVLAIRNKGIEIGQQDGNKVKVKVAAGENWHNFVLWSVKEGFGGIENLSLIPGNVGSCPIQNIGAYGVEVKDVIATVEVVNIYTGEFSLFSNAACRFGYRDSIFKNELKGTFIIWSVTFELSLAHDINLKYGAIAQEIDRLGISNPGIADVSNAVIRIRESKLPDPNLIGNAGSFFKNPTLSSSEAELLIEKYPTMVTYTLGNGQVKLAAGWLIEHCGWKGKRYGDAGVHATQSLVLVNYGKSSGNDILALASQIQASVLKEFGVHLELEVNII